MLTPGPRAGWVSVRRLLQGGQGRPCGRRLGVEGGLDVCLYGHTCVWRQITRRMPPRLDALEDECAAV